MTDRSPNRRALRTRLAGTRRAQRGVSSLMLLFLLIPLLLAVGIAVDFARMVQFRSDLQNAVDEAALAGATVFVSSTQSADATTAAQNYFKRAILPMNLSVSAPTIAPNANDTINPVLGTQAAHTVTVTATGSVQTTLMSLVAPTMVT
ncbi:MAG TPA: pilus assembly protein TadG-related protein, partial [Paraburkholderia sp.]